MVRASASSKRRPAPLSDIPGAKKAPFPAFIEPCDPTLRERVPPGDDWLFEIKADGYRAQLHRQGGRVKVYSRRGYDWTQQFRGIADAANALGSHDVALDGEAVAYGTNGLPDYQQLRRELGRRSSTRLHYLVFDLLYLDGYDLRGAPYLRRKELLQELLRGAPDTLVYVEPLKASGQRVYEEACRFGLEGVVGKRPDSRYRSGRQESWIKLKCNKSDNFPIVAFVEKLGAHPRRIASLYIGRREGDKLLYAGKVQTGYGLQTAQEVREALDPLIIKFSPLSVPVKKPKATWVRPEIETEVEYGGLTDDGLLRAAVFKGLREDLRPADATSIAPTSPRPPRSGRRIGVPAENILQLLPDAVVPAREQLAAYWTKVSARALPFLGGRPLKLVRHIHGATFYHKGPLPNDIPAAVHQLRIEKREGGEGVRLWIDSLQGFLGLLEIGVIEVHPWNAAVNDIEHPDRLVFDLDPGEGVEWPFVIDTALRLRGILEAEGLKPWPKLTGGKGVHLMIPVAPEITHDEAHRYCKSIAQRLMHENLERYTVAAAMARRPGRLFIDYLRNGRGTTAVGAYSPRARPGFPIACPVSWKQIESGIAPDAFTTTHLPRLAKRS